METSYPNCTMPAREAAYREIAQRAVELDQRATRVALWRATLRRIELSPDNVIVLHTLRDKEVQR
jgi:hypothetical protein